MVNFSIQNFIEKYKLFTIAEIGLNHGGELKKAIKLIDRAKSSNISAVKFQTYNAEERAPKNNAEIKCILEKCELSYQDHQKLKAHSNKMDIKFFSTVFDLKSLNLLEDLEVELYKIASFDIGNTVLLKEVAKTKKPVILSTGMSSKEEILEAKAIFELARCEYAFLHCISSYPTDEKDSLLSNILELQKMDIKIVGLSDHTNDIKVPLIGITMGAKIIEKHFKLDKNHECVDSIVSITPKKFKKLIRKSNEIFKIQGKPKFGLRKQETSSLQFKRKS